MSTGEHGSQKMLDPIDQKLQAVVTMLGTKPRSCGREMLLSIEPFLSSSVTSQHKEITQAVLCEVEEENHSPKSS